MSTDATPVAGMHLFYLDGAGVLFCEATQELHLLNATGALIWSLLEEGHNAISASATLAEMGGLDAASSTQFVAAALAQWRDQRFLEGVPPTQTAPSAAPAASAPVAGPAWRETAIVEERHYGILGSRFHLRFSSLEQAKRVHPVLAHLEVPESASGTTVVDIVETPNGLIVYQDRAVHATAAHVAELAPIIKSLVWIAAVNNHEFFLDIHAGVVGDGSRCILLPAPPGSGKSTLTASLVYAGYQYFSDEVALLEEGSFGVFPVPLALGIKTSGIEALAGRFPHLRSLEVHQRGDGKRVVYMTPPPASRPATDDPCPVAAMVFPRYAPDAGASLRRLSKWDALKRMLDECMAVPVRLDVAKVEALVQWIAGTPCYSLEYGNTEAAIAEVRSVFAGCAAMTAP
jgi:hypothetical protein